MKKKIFLSLVWVFMLFTAYAQTYSTSTIIERRSYTLNGGARASVGGRSRVAIKIDLPRNTRKWYYSFTTTPGEDGTKLLNLGVQVAAALYTGGMTTLASKSIEVPPGSSSVDAYVISPQYYDAFINKQEPNWQYFRDISLENSKQAVQTVEPKYGNSFYLGLRNPSAFSAINIIIEVVAVVEEVNPEADKGVFYGNLGWKAFERGELESCVEFSKKALTYNPKLSYVKFNIALVHLIQAKNEAIDEYVDAISAVKNERMPKGILSGAIKDIRDQKVKTPSLKNLTDIEELLLVEYNKY
jgi:tetratricopeptide (TPR) repeat protein